MILKIWTIIKTLCRTLISERANEIEEQNENVGASISIYNRNVELFNNQIQIFPHNIINNMLLKKKAIRPFRDQSTVINAN